MSCKIDARDFLYRKINPGGWDASGVFADAFQDKYENLSFSLVSMASPCKVLEKFAEYNSVRKKCGTVQAPNCTEMYWAVYRVAMISVMLVRANNFAFAADESENEHNAEGHINVVKGKEGAVIWSINARLLTEVEMGRGAMPLLTP